MMDSAIKLACALCFITLGPALALLLTIDRVDWRTALLILFFVAVFQTISTYLVLQHLIFEKLEKLKKTLLKFTKKKTEPQEGNKIKNPVQNVRHEVISILQTNRNEVEHLKHEQQFRRNFLADVSHELKNPIFAAQGFIETLLDGAIEDKKVRVKFLKKAAKNLNALDTLAQDILTLSYLESGNISMKKKSSICGTYALM